MFTIAARQMGYRVHTYSPEADSPTGQVADREHVGDYSDLESVSEFAKQVAVITFEFENVPSSTTEIAARFVPVRPGGRVLHVAQHRLREKTFLLDHGFPVTAFRPVLSRNELDNAIQEVGCPAILKTAGWGYDGKGQIKITSRDVVSSAWEKLETSESILEAHVDFRLELSVVATRSLAGEVVTFGVFENAHSNHILDVTVCPARISPKVAKQAEEIARGIMEALDVVGVLCVEMFLTQDDRLLVNELAPRPHNSGHLTIDAHATSQFEQQLRAVCGLPLGSTIQFKPAAMANLLGDLWENGEPNWAEALRLPGVKLHLYGKSSARPGRKMGHLTALADSVDEAERIVREARRRLQPGVST
jgi:5-(carboxyamino)imidazole ribonucleotide synthase